MTEAAPILVMALLAITFLQSGYDKIKDWKVYSWGQYSNIQ